MKTESELPNQRLGRKRISRARSVFFLCQMLVVALVSNVIAYGQSYQGGLRGAVRDASGAMMSGVELTLTSEETNTKRATATNGEGEYAFTNVLPGTYTLMAAHPGFKALENKGIRIGTQTFITLDLTLEITPTAEVVTVIGDTPIIENSNPSVGSNLDKKTMDTLPTPARNVFFLSVITPNVVPSGDPQFVRQQDQTNSSLISLAGGPRRANNYTIDGVSITDLRNRAVFIPNLEAVQEMKIQISTYDAEMGRTGGGVFNVTARSGSNDWHGSALIQNRPDFAQANSFFSKRKGALKPETYYWLYGGSFGGPIIGDRTFFWASTENYKTKTTRNGLLILPTERELSGDFSQSGITIYDPLTTRPDPNRPGQFIRDPFPGNKIPANRINTVAQALTKFWPKPDSGNTATRTAEMIDRANQATGKVDHRFSDKFTITGLYAWYNSEEPLSRFYGKNSGDNPGDPGDIFILRTVHAIAINNIFVPDPNTVFAFRYGYARFRDDTVPLEFDPAQLGFSQDFLKVIPFGNFPSLNVEGYGSSGFPTFGAGGPQYETYYSHNFNVSMSKLIDRHTLAIGGEYRRMGLNLFSRGQSSGRFTFSKNFTQGPNPLTSSLGAGSSLASLLLGFPASGDVAVASPNRFYVDYYGGFIQDDFRLRPSLTLNLGLRYEFEQGMKERDNHFTVGFDRERPFPEQAPGLNLKGGLMYAGVDGYQTHQGDPSKTRFAPRVGFAWSLNSRTVVRGGYGLFYAPIQYPFPTENRYGTRGFTGVTTYFASSDGGLTPCSTCTLTNPFPNGVEQPTGSSNGLLTGAGGDVNFVDQFRKSSFVHQYSFDLQRELRGKIVVSVGYVGGRSEKLLIGGTNSNTVNINQLDPKYLSLGASLLERVSNPMFGNPAFGALSRQQTVPRGQLLRPYPQFLNIFAHQVSEGFARYNSLVLRLEKRISNDWGANINYTYGSNMDNLFGEVNFFSNNSSGLARSLNNYDLDAELAHSILETPHRLNISGIYELPFGQGKRWLSEGGFLGALVGGWTVSAIGSYQSGFPSLIVQNNNNSGLFGSFQRPNVVPGVNPATSGRTVDRLDNWFNPAAWTEAPPFTFGNAPRTDTRIRTPSKRNWDVALQKTQNLTEKLKLSVRVEMINALNDPNLLGPATLFGRSDFGKITQVGGFPRLLQVMARVHW